MRLSVPEDRLQGRAGLRGRNIVPMINVVFLLLIFFLMAARLSAPAPVAVTLPRAAGRLAGAAPDVEIHIDAAGEAAFGDLRGPAAVAGAAALAGPDASLTIRADAAAEAAALAALLPQLAGFGRVALATAPE
jgi:biopolymer transport protein ExbD